MKVLKEKLSLKCFLFVIAAFFLVQVPFVGNYIKCINTLIHESGHALIALFGGKVETISLFMNSEGVTYSRQSTWIGSLLTSLAGYIFSSFMAFLSFFLIKKRKQTLMIDILLVFIILNLLFWVRNPYGLFWLVSFGLLFLYLLIKGSEKFRNHLLLLIAAIILVDSVKSAYEILLISFQTPNNAGDAGNLAHLTMIIPVQIWGLFFFLQALGFCYLGLRKGHYHVQL